MVTIFAILILPFLSKAQGFVISLLQSSIILLAFILLKKNKYSIFNKDYLDMLANQDYLTTIILFAVGRIFIVFVYSASGGILHPVSHLSLKNIRKSLSQALKALKEIIRLKSLLKHIVDNSLMTANNTGKTLSHTVSSLDLLEKITVFWEGDRIN